MVTIDDLKRTPAGRYYFNFVPQSEDELITLPALEDCLGSTEISDIQIERGLYPTYYEEPSDEAVPASGLWKDLSDIRIEMTDPESSFWARIHMNNEAYLREYGTDLITSMVGQTADSIYSRVESKNQERFTDWEQRQEGIRIQVVDEISSNITTAMSNMYQQRLANIDGSINTLTATAEGLQRQITNNDGDINILTQKADGLQSLIADAEGNISLLQSTAQGLQRSIRDAEGNISSLSQIATGLQTRIRDAEGNISTVTQLANGLNTKITGWNGIESQITQLNSLIQSRVTRSDVESIIGQSGDAIWLQLKSRVEQTAGNSKMTGREIISAINLTTSGATISGKYIYLDSDTTYTNNFVSNISTSVKINANQITAGTIDASRIRVINLDVYSLTGGVTSFIQSHWNGINSNLSVNANYLRYTHRDGSYTQMSANGLEYYDSGSTYHTHYLIHVENVQVHHSPYLSDVKGAYLRVQLPRVFAGKDFKAFVTMADVFGAVTEPNYIQNRLMLKRTVLTFRNDGGEAGINKGTRGSSYDTPYVDLVGYGHYVNRTTWTDHSYPIQGQLIVIY